VERVVEVEVPVERIRHIPVPYPVEKVVEKVPEPPAPPPFPPVGGGPCSHVLFFACSPIPYWLKEGVGSVGGKSV